MADDLPASVEAEEAVLGAILTAPEVIWDVLPVVRPADFYIVRHRWIFECIVDLVEARRSPDYLSVVEALKASGKLDETGGPAYVGGLMREALMPYRAPEHAALVRELSRKRQLARLAQQLAEMAYDRSLAADEALGRAESALFAIAQDRPGRSVEPLGRVMAEYFEHLGYLRDHPEALRGIPTGFVDLDRILHGLRKTEMITIAGRPAMGKTSLLVDIALNAARQGCRVAAFSLEMSDRSLARRLVASETGIDGQALDQAALSDDDWGRVAGAVGRLGELPIVLDDSPDLTPLELRSKCRAVAAGRGLDLVVVDYLQLMSSDRPAENRVQEISAISRGLKALAKELDVPVVVAAQLNRAVEARGDKRPQVADLRESGQIEQDSDVVMLLYRDEVYNPDTVHKNVAEVIVGKQRQGPTGVCRLRYDGARTRFQNLAREVIL